MFGKRDWVTVGLITLAQIGLGVGYYGLQEGNDESAAVEKIEKGQKQQSAVNAQTSKHASLSPKKSGTEKDIQLTQFEKSEPSKLTLPDVPPISETGGGNATPPAEDPILLELKRQQAQNQSKTGLPPVTLPQNNVPNLPVGNNPSPNNNGLPELPPPNLGSGNLPSSPAPQIPLPPVTPANNQTIPEAPTLPPSLGNSQKQSEVPAFPIPTPNAGKNNNTLPPVVPPPPATNNGIPELPVPGNPNISRKTDPGQMELLPVMPTPVSEPTKNNNVVPPLPLPPSQKKEDLTPPLPLPPSQKKEDLTPSLPVPPSQKKEDLAPPIQEQHANKTLPNLEMPLPPVLPQKKEQKEVNNPLPPQMPPAPIPSDQTSVPPVSATQPSSPGNVLLTNDQQTVAAIDARNPVSQDKKQGCPWKLKMEIAAGRTILTAKTDEGAEFLIRCDEMALQRPGGNVSATGNVEIITGDHIGKCQKLTIAWAEDRLEMRGDVSFRSRTRQELMEFKSDSLTLRLSGVQGNTMPVSTK